MITQNRVTKLFLLLCASCLIASPALMVDCRQAQAAPESFQAAPLCGKPAPEFSLTDTNGKVRDLRDYKGKFVVLEWFNQGCPFVKKHYESGNMQKLQKDYTEKGVVWLSICSSAPGKQGNCSAQEHNNAFQAKHASPTAILIDEDGKVGRLYAAKTTPDMFVINPKGVLIYSGAIDDKNDTAASSVSGARNYVREVLDEAMSGKQITVEPTPSYGCSVKYL